MLKSESKNIFNFTTQHKATKDEKRNAVSVDDDVWILKKYFLFVSVSYAENGKPWKLFQIKKKGFHFVNSILKRD